MNATLYPRPTASEVGAALNWLRLVEAGGEIFEPGPRHYREPHDWEVADARATWWALHIARQCRPLPL